MLWGRGAPPPCEAPTFYQKAGPAAKVHASISRSCGRGPCQDPSRQRFSAGPPLFGSRGPRASRAPSIGSRAAQSPGSGYYAKVAHSRGGHSKTGQASVANRMPPASNYQPYSRSHVFQACLKKAPWLPPSRPRPPVCGTEGRGMEMAVPCSYEHIPETLCTIHYTLYTIILYTTHHTLHTIHYTLYILHLALYTIQYIIHNTLVNAMQYTTHNIIHGPREPRPA